MKCSTIVSSYRFSFWKGHCNHSKMCKKVKKLNRQKKNKFLQSQGLCKKYNFKALSFWTLKSCISILSCSEHKYAVINVFSNV